MASANGTQDANCRVSLSDVREAATVFSKARPAGTNDPILFLMALGIEVVREDGTVIGDE